MTASPRFSPAAAVIRVFVPILLWGTLLGALANQDSGSAWVTGVVLAVLFAAGLLILKPLVLVLGAVALSRMFWGIWRGRQVDGAWEERGARAIGLIYAPIYGGLAAGAGVWDGWSPGGMSAIAAGALFGCVGFAHALAVHRHTLVGAVGVLAVTEGGEGDAGGGESAPRRVNRGPAQDG